jgi:hypothetical protein
VDVGFCSLGQVPLALWVGPWACDFTTMGLCASSVKCGPAWGHLTMKHIGRAPTECQGPSQGLEPRPSPTESQPVHRGMEGWTRHRGRGTFVQEM